MSNRSGAATALLGFFAGVGFLLLTSQAISSSAPIRVQYVPNPKDFVQIDGNVPYMVPVGKLFVLTGIGLSENTLGIPFSVALSVNGIVQASAIEGSSSVGGSLVNAVPVGFTVPSGSVITMSTAYAPTVFPTRAWGYLYQP